MSAERQTGSNAARISYRAIWYRAVTVTPQVFIDAFPLEWADAQKRGLDENSFARESLRECDFETLVELGSDEIDEFDVEPV